MNIRKILTIAILLLSTIFYLAANCDPEPDPVPVDPTLEPTVVGTWANSDYNDSGWPESPEGMPAKQVVSIVGSTITTSVFKNVSDTEPIGTYIGEIIEEWTDDNGARWYKTTVNVDPESTVYGLAKVSSDNLTLEGVSYFDDFPTEIDTENDGYAIMYRQTE